MYWWWIGTSDRWYVPSLFLGEQSVLQMNDERGRNWGYLSFWNNSSKGPIEKDEQEGDGFRQESAIGSRRLFNCGWNDKIWYPLLQFPPLLPSDKVTTGTEGRSTAVYFWTSKILHEGTAERIGSMIGEVICELQQEGINVTSYATDNCSVMWKTEQYVQHFVLRPIQRVACAFHVLNGIFKDLLKLGPIKEVWNNVLFLSLFHIGL